jgi:hypothetical protein
MPSIGRKECPSCEQGLQQEPRVEEASNKHPSARVTEKTEAHLPNGHAQGTKHDKSVTEKSCGPHAHDKAGVPTPTEKVNGSAFNDKGKKTRGEPPFTKQEREEMETLLGDLCGHLGQLSWI